MRAIRAGRIARRCLKCEKIFSALGKYNRVCAMCSKENFSTFVPRKAKLIVSNRVSRNEN